MESCCGGRRLSNACSWQPRGRPPCHEQARGGLRRPWPESIAHTAFAAERATDTLSVVWLRGTFGRGAQASSAGFLYHMNCLEHVYTKVGPSGVPPPVS